jgi:hypothetical protein
MRAVRGQEVIEFRKRADINLSVLGDQFIAFVDILTRIDSKESNPAIAIGVDNPTPERRR